MRDDEWGMRSVGTWGEQDAWDVEQPSEIDSRLYILASADTGMDWTVPALFKITDQTPIQTAQIQMTTCETLTISRPLACGRQYVLYMLSYISTTHCCGTFRRTRKY